MTDQLDFLDDLETVVARAEYQQSDEFRSINNERMRGYNKKNYKPRHKPKNTPSVKVHNIMSHIYYKTR